MYSINFFGIPVQYVINFVPLAKNACKNIAKCNILTKSYYLYALES